MSSRSSLVWNFLGSPVEEGELSRENVDQSEPDKTQSKIHSCKETVCCVCSLVGWSDIPDLEYQPSSRDNIPWIGSRSQPVGKASIAVPSDKWLCKKFEDMNLTILQAYPN